MKTTAHRSALDDLAKLRVFTEVVEAGTFSAAGRRLGIVPSTVSKHISSLEAQLRGQLITRSTQQLSVTELGQRFYERCRVILHEVEVAEQEVREYQGEPQGLLRLSVAPVLAVGHLMTLMAKFAALHPKVDLEVTVTPESQNLFASGIDAALRITREPDPDLVAVKLGLNERVFCASPEYLRRHGAPNDVAALKEHNCLVIKNVVQSAEWPMRNEAGRRSTVSVSGNFVSNNADLVRQALLAHMGIGHIALFLVERHLADGSLVELFPDQRVLFSRIYVVFPKRRHLPLKTRAFVDFVRDHFQAGTMASGGGSASEQPSFRPPVLPTAPPQAEGSPSLEGG